MPNTQSTTIIGIDLSGPRNVPDTCVAVFQERGKDLCFRQVVHGAGDRQILEIVSSTAGDGSSPVIGIDAPLSYNPGGGDRPSDKALRRLVSEKGRTGIMPPTMIRMVYLTLRGVALTRMLEALRLERVLRIVEVHPGACMLLHGADPTDVSDFKRELPARVRLLDWLDRIGLKDIPRVPDTSDHFVAACAAALAAWQWAIGKPAWCHPASPPEHPYDFTC